MVNTTTRHNLALRPPLGYHWLRQCCARLSITIAIFLLIAVISSLASAQSNPGPGQGPAIPGLRRLPAVETAAAPPFEVPAPKPSVSLVELEQMALAHHPAVQEAAAAVEAARGRAVQAGLRQNPSIGYEGTDIGEEGTAGKHAGIVQQQILTGGKRTLAQQAAEREVFQLQQQLNTVTQRVSGDVRMGYYDVIFSQRRIDISRQLSKIADTIVDVARRRLEAKDVSSVDLLQSQAEAHRIALQLTESEIQYRAAWRRLASVVSGVEMTQVPLVDEVPPALPRLNFNGAVTRLRAESPEMATAEAGVERARAQLRLAEAGRYPNVTLRGGVQKNYVSDNTQGEIGIMLPLQLYDRNQGAIQEADAQLLAAEREVDRVDRQLQQRLAVAFQQYDLAYSRAERYARDILPRVRQARELIERGYSQGEFRYDELLIAQRSVVQADLDYISALNQLWQTVALIDNLLLSESLADPTLPPMP
ncbi:MAG: TolC family protein [Planctomycetes bacterium]|nr:TolC family protein [Planctomycetota bacterium]